MSDDADPRHPRLVALITMLGRTGAQEFQLRYSDDEQPVIWMAAARWGDIWQAAGALTPYRAAFRLAESVLDGGLCVHCQRPTAIDDEPADELLRATEAQVCWYRYDPELSTFRRGCEGAAA